MYTKILMHELDHTLIKEYGGQKLIDEAWKATEPEKRQAVIDKYTKFYRLKPGMSASKLVEILNDEVNSAYAEELATDERAWKYILQKEPTVKEKVLSFFGKKSTEYETLEGMSAEAKKYLKHFKQLFNRLSEERQGTNALKGKTVAKAGEEKSGMYDIGVLEDGSTYVIYSRNVITGETVSDMRRNITDFFNELLGKNKSLDIPTVEGDVLTITKKETAKKARDKYKSVNGQLVEMSDDEFALKSRVESHIDEIAETANKDGQKSDQKKHTFAQKGFEYRTTYFQDFDGKIYSVTISIGTDGKTATVYNVGKIKEEALPSAKLIAVAGSKPQWSASSRKSIAQSESDVNRKTKKSEKNFSDTDGRMALADEKYIELAKDPEKNENKLWEMLKKSAFENGYEKLIFHGTPGLYSTTLDTKYSDDGISFFASDDIEVTGWYANTQEQKDIGKNIKENKNNNYAFFAKTDDLYVVEGNKSQWNDILDSYILKDPNKLLKEYPDEGYEIEDFNDYIEIRRGRSRGTYYWNDELEQYEFGDGIDVLPEKIDGFIGGSTRDISRRVYESGKYRGVIFKNIYDSGYGTHLADVYNFFYPQQDVKSADLVTYDDNGKIIPLSERFNAENTDIRFSLAEDKDGGKKDTAESETLEDFFLQDRKRYLEEVANREEAERERERRRAESGERKPKQTRERAATERVTIPGAESIYKRTDARKAIKEAMEQVFESSVIS